MNQVSKSEAGNIKNLIKNGGKKDIKKVLDFVRKNKGIEYAVETSRKYSQNAKDAIKIFPESPAKIALEALVDFIIDRKN